MTVMHVYKNGGSQRSDRVSANIRWQPQERQALNLPELYKNIEDFANGDAGSIKYKLGETH